MSQDVFPENRDIFYRCVEDSNDAIMLTDRKGKLLYVNRAWQTIYGYSRKEIEGQTPRMLRSRHQEDRFYVEMWKEILDPAKGFWKGELINLSKMGQEVPVLLSITPYRNEDGEVHGYMGIAVDISERKKMEAQILQQDRLASVGLLASGLAHEVGTPLGVIRGRAEYLSSMATSDHKMKAGLDVIVAQIDRISKLIYTLLNLARPDKDVDVRVVEVPKTLATIETLVEQKLRLGGIAWENDVLPNTKVLAEPDRLTQVILNLVMNSIYAIQVRFKKDPNAPKRISVSSFERESTWEIIVEDTGCGISKENLQHLFKPFFTTKDVGEGTGLGLAVTLQIVQSWNGSIHVESVHGQGTRFLLQIPKAKN